MDISTLEKIGLTRNESIVYIALLRIGTSKSGEILIQSKLNSGKIYEILESLKEKGLVSESVINNIRHFTSAPPSQILEYLHRKKDDLEQDEDIIKKALPELDKIKNTPFKGARAVTYTGFRGIMTGANEALEAMKEGEDIVAMGITAKKDIKYNEFWKGWSTKRIDRKINCRHIFSERSEYSEAFKRMKYTQVRVLTGITPVAVDIFGERIVKIINYEEPASTTLIYDKNTAISFRNFFDQLWNLAKP